MYDPAAQYEKEEEILFAMHDRGELTDRELNMELRQLQADYEAERESAAREAYEAEWGRW